MAFGAGTINSIGGAVQDLFAADAHRSKAAGDEFEKQNYGLAADLADQNAKFTETSTAIKLSQIDRENFKVMGGQQADVASAGFEASGSALDLMRDSAAQGALHHAVAGEQGLITEAGYTEQATSYRNMQQAAQVAIDAENKAAEGSEWGAAFKGIAAVASIGLAPFTGGASLAIGGALMGGGSPSGYGSG